MVNCECVCAECFYIGFIYAFCCRYILNFSLPVRVEGNIEKPHYYRISYVRFIRIVCWMFLRRSWNRLLCWKMKAKGGQVSATIRVQIECEQHSKRHFILAECIGWIKCRFENSCCNRAFFFLHKQKLYIKLSSRFYCTFVGIEKSERKSNCSDTHQYSIKRQVFPWHFDKIGDFSKEPYDKTRLLWLLTQNIVIVSILLPPLSIQFAFRFFFHFDPDILISVMWRAGNI